MIPKSYRWRKTALASLLAALCGLSGSTAFALALGRITVQSALGDPLRAEIDILDINAEEASSLKTSLALPEAFRAAGLEYNAALAGAQISLQRRADGRAFIRLTSDKPVTEPFVDLIVEASWASGRIVRDYTMLLDPPSLRAVTAVTPATPQVSAATISAAPVIGSRSAPAPIRPATVTRRPPATTAAVEVATAKPRGNDQNQVTVRPGDNASKIAAATKPAQVSLDQMLVALLRANQDAFINSNLNRLKAGAVLTIPTAEQAQALTAPEASKTVIAQSRDFNDFRSKLASNAPNLPVAAADRKAGGNIQAQLDDKKAAATTPDKLTLSKGAIQAKAAEERIAQEKAAKDATQRTAELSKNIKDLSSLGAASGAAPPAPAAAPAPTALAVPAPTTPVVVASAPAPVTTPAVAAVATTPAVPVVATTPAVPVLAAPPSSPPKIVPAPAEPGLFDKLLENPIILLALAALIALLAGLGIYKARQRRSVAEVDSAFLESRLQPDSFFGASGGQRVDTNDGAATGSSMVYSPSQLDAADDVDPVAEADVYLAYGRDLQAEEILKEALRTHPGRIAVHQKLLEIYAKRRDAKAFEAMANEAFKLTGEQSPEWARICEQGLGIDPTNTLYQPGGQPSLQQQTVALPANDLQSFAATSAATQKLIVPIVAAPAPVDLDLDLDFSLDEEPASAIVEAQPSQLERTVAISPVASAPAPLDMDFGVTTEAMAAPAGPPKVVPLEVDLPGLSIANDTVAIPPSDSEDFRQQAEVSFGSTSPIPLQSNHAAQTPFTTVDAPLPDLSFGYTAPGELTASQAPLNSPPAADSGMLEFDLGTLSLDLDPLEDKAAAGTFAEPEDPLATKLALAEEFVSIGDDDGARALIEEVIAEASGDLKVRAQRALSSLG